MGRGMPTEATSMATSFAQGFNTISTAKRLPGKRRMVHVNQDLR
jgi:hypothetical protein